MAVFDESKQKKRVEELRQKEEEELARILSQKYHVSYVDLSRVSINTEALGLIPEKEAREGQLAAFDRVGKKLSVAVRSPVHPQTKSSLDKLTENGYEVTVYMVSTQSLERAWNRYKDILYTTETKAGILEISSEEIKKLLGEVKTIDDARKLVEETMALKRVYRISRILEIVIAGGLGTDATDIHVEPEEDYVRLRYRLDGVLTDAVKFDRETYGLLLSRIKLLSGLKLNIKNIAQDGRFSIRVEPNDIEVRTSILPGGQGESIVLRLLNPATLARPMEELGLGKALFEIIERELHRPNGMILTTGPTGSGKTTTLYAFMRRIHTPQIKIITIEDPIEYRLPGIVQTQIDKKSYTFAKGLRSALRQDPDVIMIGEVRDEEVAETAVNAALTGHLVFSTLHTNTAAGAFPRLIDLGVDPKVIPSAVNLVLAQRLVRILCPSCKKKVPLSGKNKAFVERIVSSMPEKERPQTLEFHFEAVGCAVCSDTGYRGRIGIFEGILMDKNVEALVREGASEREIAEKTKDQGIPTMLQNGVVKVLEGTTTLDELARVIDLGE